MKSCYFKEQRRYSKDELCKAFNCNGEVFFNIVKKLREYNVIKIVKKTAEQKDLSDLADIDIETDFSSDNVDVYYVFAFVGVIVVAREILIICYPKYIFKDEPISELKLILKVIEKYNSKYQIKGYSDINNTSSNFLSVLLFFVNDYFENGTYSKKEQVIELNGNGEIAWEKTINETFMFLSNNVPYYLDLKTKRQSEDTYNYFKRLYECIVTRASKELKEVQLLELFDITGIDLSDESLDDFGETEYILYRIEKELSVEFNTRRQIVLKAMYSYLSHKASVNDADSFNMFGTNSFNLVWEDVCQCVFDNQLDKKLENLCLPESLNNKYDNDRNKKLIEIIDKPLWTITGKHAEDTLIPDLITIKDGKFIIFDAKYYVPILEDDKTPESQPGIESVAKQYLYQLAYQEFISDYKLSVRNCFVFPTDKDVVENKEEVELKFLKNINLTGILVRMLPAEDAYKKYLSEKNYDISELKLD